MVYIVVAVGAAALLLPTALRPPVDQQSTSAAFSPDAPPDDTPPEALLQSIRQASSSTAGAATNQDAPPAAETVVQQAPPPPPVRKAVRNKCFGDPPRQTESLYSSVCVPAWTGSDNGGATTFGVTADRILIGYGVGQSSTVPTGPLPFEFSDTDSSDTHDLKVWQAYFNQAFEMYGRKLQLDIQQQSITDENQQRQSVAAFQTDGTFAITAPAYGQPSAAQAETVRRHMIDVGSVLNPCSYYANNHPYAYSFIMDGCRAVKFHTDLICKQFGADRPLGDRNLNGRQDLTFDYNAPRKYGLVVYEDETHYGAQQGYADELAKCGISLVAKQSFNLTSNQQDIAATMAKMKQNGVTTVIIATEVYTPIVLTAAASKLAYYPEWIQMGLETNASARLYDADQIKHMVGTAGQEIAREPTDTDWYRAYKEIEPDGTPAEDAFRSLQLIANGIQGAGPKLTPETFWEGLQKTPYRAPDPVWSVGGGYGPNDYTFMDYGGAIWWNPNGHEPTSTSTGAWEWVLGGQRWKPGEIPTDPFPWFDESQSITSPPPGIQG